MEEEVDPALEEPAGVEDGDGDKAGLAFEVAPQEGYVRLIRCGLQTYLVNDVSLESVALGIGDYQLHADADGFVALVDIDTGEPQLVEDRFSVAMYRHQLDGAIWLVGADGARTPLASLQRDFREGKCEWQYGVNHCTSLPTACLKLARDGCKVYFSMIELYKALGLSTYAGCASKWAYNTRKTYEPKLKELGLTQAFLASGQSLKAEDGATSVTQFLPHPAISTIGLFYFLGRVIRHKSDGYVASEEHGALGPTDLHRHDYLLGIIRGLVSHNTKRGRLLKLPIKFDYTWANPWPARVTENPCDVQLFIDASGTIDLKPWLALADLNSKRHGGAASVWLHNIKTSNRCEPHINMVELLSTLVHGRQRERYRGLLLQVLVWLAGRRVPCSPSSS